MIQLNDINRMYCEYFKTTGREPKRVYLGHEEYRYIRSLGEVYIHESIIEGKGYTAKIMGLTVFEVDENNHVFVC